MFGWFGRCNTIVTKVKKLCAYFSLVAFVVLAVSCREGANSSHTQPIESLEQTLEIQPQNKIKTSQTITSPYFNLTGTIQKVPNE